MLNTSRRFDVIVIGAGLEGLICAALLSKRGKQVIVLEEAPTPGGASVRITKSDYTFIKGPNLFLGFERDGLYDRLFSELGLSLAMLKREGLLFRKSHPPLQIVLPNHRLEYYADSGDLLEELQREFPDDVQGVRGLWSEIAKDEEVIRPRMQQAHRMNPQNLPERVSGIREWMRYSTVVRRLQRQRVEDVFGRYRLGPEIKRGMEMLLLIFIGKSMEEATGLDLIQVLGLMQREILMVSGGIPRLCDLLIKIIQENHGEVVYRQPVTEILHRHRHLEGIRTQEGRTVHGATIIVNLPRTVDAHISSPGTTYTLYFGIEDRVLPAPMKDHLLFLNSYDAPTIGDNFLYLQVSNIQDGWAAPKGRRALQVIGYLPKSNLPRPQLLASLIPPVTAHLNSLMPFSDEALTRLGDDLDETEAATRIPPNLSEQIGTTRMVYRDGASYGLTPFKKIYWLPDLGHRPVASVESARSAVEMANLVAKIS